MDLDRLFEQADFVTIHLLKTPESTGLIGDKLLAQAKPELRIINVARGGIVDEEALADGRPAAAAPGGAALDVFSSEPGEGGALQSPVLDLPTVVVTPHLGATTPEAQDKAGITIAEQVLLALAGEFVPFAVNVERGGGSARRSPALPPAGRAPQPDVHVAQ